MKKSLVFYIFLLMLQMIACGQEYKVIPSGKQIDVDSVEVIPSRFNIDIDSTDCIKIIPISGWKAGITLKENLAKVFLSKLNNAKPKPNHKIVPKFQIEVYMFDRTMKSFSCDSLGIILSETKCFDLNDTILIESIWKDRNSNMKYTSGYSPKDYTPMSTIKLLSRDFVPRIHHPAITMFGKFPEDWVKESDIERLISIINSSEKCNCLVNVVSSSTPRGTAEVGGYAAAFINAFKEQKAVDFGLWACPKVDEDLNAELISWWKKRKN